MFKERKGVPMLHFLFNRRSLIILATSLLVALIVPTTVFAASAAVSTTITSRCGIEGAQVIVTLNKGQEIKVTAVATGNDGTHEDEALSVFAEGHRFIKVITANTGPRTFEFTAKENGVNFDACWSLVRNDDDGDYASASFFVDHVATVTYKFTD